MNDGFPHGQEDLFSQPFFQLVGSKNRVYTDVAAVESMGLDEHIRFAGHGQLQPAKLRLVSGNYFSMLGVGARLGRVFSERDDQKAGANAVAVMSSRYWERQFAERQNVLGSTFAFNGVAFTIVGVAAPEFFGTEVGEAPDFWIPLSMQAQVQPWLDKPQDPLTQSLWLMARKKPGITLAQAQANSNLIFHQWLRAIAGSSPSAERLQDMRKAYAEVMDASAGFSQLRRRFSRSLQILMVLVGIVLLIACVNVANLLLARATGRSREIAVRLALGAQRRRLVFQLISENLVLALIGGTLGVLFAVLASRVLLALISTGPETVPLNVNPNGTVLLFTLGVSLATGLLFGIVPALRATSTDESISVQEGKGLARSNSKSRLGQILISAQVGLALFLMIGAGLFIRTLQKLEHTSPGFEQDRTLLLQIDQDSSAAKGPGLVNLCQRIEKRIQMLPGVQAASFSMLNFGEGHWISHVWRQGAPHSEATAISFAGNRVGEQYFGALGIPLLAGRNFGAQDIPKSPGVAVVDETFARKLFPGVFPLGRHFELEDGASLEIIGVVKDFRHEDLREPDEGMFFISNDQGRIVDGFNDLVVRCQRPSQSTIGDIREAIRQGDPNLAISDVMTLGEEVDRSLGEEKLLAKLAGFFAIAALLLASIGIYGIMAYQVARRTNEIGIRMALGAQPGNMLADILKDSMSLVGVGFLIAIPATLACGSVVANQLYGVPPNDPFTISTVTTILLITALVAAIIPARRAAKIDPVIALRYQ